MSPDAKKHTGLAVAVIAGAQLMIVLDMTIVNVALPTIKTALGFSPTGLSWIVNAYTLVFGGLLLLGGRSGDLFGRRKMFTLGTLLFASASFFGGLATSQAWLLTGRALQGIGAAIASPTALSLISTNFVEPKQRGKAFAIYSAVSAGGAAIGLLAGGLLTQYLSWRWVFFVNTPIALILAVLTPRVLAESPRVKGRIDIIGGIVGTGSLAAIVYGLIHASTSSWTNSTTLGFLAAGLLALAGFVIYERKKTDPLIDFSILADRDRGGAIAMILFVSAGMFGIFFFLTQFIQEIIGYSPTKTGVAFLPMTLGVIVFAQIASRLLHKLGPKPFMMIGGLAIAGSMYWLSYITPHTTYSTIIWPLLLMAAGAGFSFVSIFPTATHKVPHSKAGMASALVNVGQQVGGTIGLSSLVTLAVAAGRSKFDSLKPALAVHQLTVSQAVTEATVKGWAMGFRLAAAFGLAAFLIATVVVKRLEAQDVAGTESPGIAA
jgi:EmrB/QacA subfamily drug resistance transporter